MGQGWGEEEKEEVKKATFPTLLTMIVGQWFSASGLLTVIAPGTVSSCGQVILYHPFSLVNVWVELEGRLLIAEFCRGDVTFRILGSHVSMHLIKKTRT